MTQTQNLNMMIQYYPRQGIKTNLFDQISVNYTQILFTVFQDILCSNFFENLLKKKQVTFSLVFNFLLLQGSALLHKVLFFQCEKGRAIFP